MIHRDLKPANVMVDDQFRLKLIDFGLAKPVDKLHGYASTATGTLIGTPFYMSPEQLKGKKDLTPASDVYAGGTLVYELFVGHPPHQAESFADVVLKAYTETIPLDLPALPLELIPFFDRCLQRGAGERIADGRQALNEFSSPAQQANRRLRHEYFKQAWVPVLERGLLEKFAADNLGVLPDDATDQFQRLIRDQGLPECDAERLAEILPPIFAAQHKVQVAEETVATAKQRFAADVTRLSADQMRQRADEVHRLEAAVNTARGEVTTEVRRLLAAEVAAWESLVEGERRAAAAAEAKRQEEIRLRAEAERKRRDAEEVQRRLEAEQKQRKREAQEQRELEEAEQRRREQEVRARDKERRRMEWAEWWDNPMNVTIFIWAIIIAIVIIGLLINR